MYCDWPLLGRCCFCLPLRQGVLTFGCIHFVFSAVMIGLCSYSTDHADTASILLTGHSLMMPLEMCLAFYCFELIFAALLIYGAYTKVVAFLKAYYYYTLVSVGALLVLQILEVSQNPSIVEEFIFGVAGLCLQLYLIILVRSLIRKMEISDSHGFDNDLNKVVIGEINANGEKVYNETTSEPKN